MHARPSLGLLTITLILALFLSLSPARPAAANHLRSDAVGMFYMPLAPYGTWIQHTVYGRAWFPHNVPVDWRPYQDGYWEYTYQYGWLWVSDREWGWATDHYGRWVWDDWYGWIWVPGAVWAPAWVVWRYGDGYVSWAPMPIQYIWNPYVSYATYYFDFDRYIAWDCWVITHERDFPRRHRPRRWLPPRMNREILHRTRYADPLVVVDKNVVNRGVPVERIERATGSALRPVAPKVLSEGFERRDRARPSQHNDEVLIYRPLDIPLTAETLRDEAESGKALAEKIRLNRPFSAESREPAGGFSEPRRPGRFIGRAKPLEHQQAEEPVTVQPLPPTSPIFPAVPETQEKLPEVPMPIEAVEPYRESLDRSGRFRGAEEGPTFGRLRQGVQEERETRPFNPRENRGQDVPVQGNRQQLQELERQQQAEQERMRQEVLQQQEDATRARQLRRLERQQQAEEERMQQEAFRQRQQENVQHQRAVERQRRAEEERMQQEAFRQQQRQQEVMRQQQLETERQQRAEVERRQQEAFQQQQQIMRQQQLESERQQRAVEDRRQQEEFQQQQQQEIVRQQQLEVERPQRQSDPVPYQRPIQPPPEQLRHEPRQEAEPSGNRGRGRYGSRRGRE